MIFEGEENEEVRNEDRNYDHLDSGSQVKKKLKLKSMIFFMANISSSLQRHSGSNINCNDDKLSHYSQKKNLLTIYHQNICGLSNKINELINFLHTNFPDVLSHRTPIKTGTIRTYLS